MSRRRPSSERGQGGNRNGRRSAPTTRLLAAGLIDWTGTGFYLAISAIFLTRAVGLSVAEVGTALAGVGMVAFLLSVPVARLGDRVGQRRALVGLHLVRAAAFVSLAAVGDLVWVLAALAVVAVADQAAASVTQALAGELVASGQRVAFMARLRTVTNIGITLGTVPAGLVLAANVDSFSGLLVTNAATYLVAAALLLSIPVPKHAVRAPERRRFLRPSRPTAGLMTVDGVMSMWNIILNVGLPLWVVGSTAAPVVMVAVLYATNTVLVVVLQSRLSRRIRTYVGAANAQRLAGSCLATSCVCLAISATGSAPVATAALTLAVLALTLGELLKASAAWHITFTLAPDGHVAEFIATYGLGRAACQVMGPLVITAGVLTLGAPGWLLLATIFVLAGAVTPPFARRALARPVRPPRSHPGHDRAVTRATSAPVWLRPLDALTRAL